MIKLVNTLYKYKIDNSITDILEREYGYYYTVKWNKTSPDSLQWHIKNKPTKRLRTYTLNKTICKILNIDFKNVSKVEFIMGVTTDGEDDFGRKYYKQFLSKIYLYSNEQL